MGKIKKAKDVVVQKKLEVPRRDQMIAKANVPPKKTLKEKIRKSLGLKSPKKTSLKLTKNEQNAIVQAVEENSAVTLKKKSKKQTLTNGSPVIINQKTENVKPVKNNKRKQIAGEIEEDCVPGRYVLNRPVKVTKKNENECYKNFEEKYKIQTGTVKSGFEAVQTLLEEEANKHNKLFDDEQPIFLQLTAVKVPKCPTRIARLPLKFSLFAKTNDICLIVPDVKHINVKETEQVKDYYETLLASKDVKNIKTVLPFYQLKTEYSEFELKRRLVELYDVFLVDGRIGGRVARLLGKIFYKKRRVPVPIKFDSVDLKETIDKALLKTHFYLHSKGNSYVVQIANSNMNQKQKIANFWSAIESLSEEFPGGWENVRSLHLKGCTTTSVPVYLTLKITNDVETPIVQPKRPKAFVPISDELTTKVNSKVTVYPTGEVVAQRISKKRPSNKGKKQDEISTKKKNTNKKKTTHKPQKSGNKAETLKKQKQLNLGKKQKKQQQQN